MSYYPGTYIPRPPRPPLPKWYEPEYATAFRGTNPLREKRKADREALERWTRMKQSERDILYDAYLSSVELEGQRVAMERQAAETLRQRAKAQLDSLRAVTPPGTEFYWNQEQGVWKTDEDVYLTNDWQGQKWFDRRIERAKRPRKRERGNEK